MAKNNKMIWILIVVGIVFVMSQMKKESYGWDTLDNADMCVYINDFTIDTGANTCQTPCVKLTSTMKTCLQKETSIDISSDWYFLADSDRSCSVFKDYAEMKCVFGGGLPVFSCTSGDSSNSFYIKDTTSNYYTTSVTDKCLNSEAVIEYSCDGSYIRYDETICEGGCSDGVCLQPCTNDCVSGAVRCNGNSKESCGNYDDADSCLEWGGSVNCPTGCTNGVCNTAQSCESAGFYCCTGTCSSPNSGYSCTSGTCCAGQSACSGGSCNTAADTNCDSHVNNQELISYISLWISGSISNQSLLNGISAWIQG